MLNKESCLTTQSHDPSTTIGFGFTFSLDPRYSCLAGDRRRQHHDQIERRLPEYFMTLVGIRPSSHRVRSHEASEIEICDLPLCWPSICEFLVVMANRLNRPNSSISIWG